MAAKRKLTWDKAGQRWQKVYLGKTYRGPRGVSKSDPVAYQEALTGFEEWRGKISKPATYDKPNGKNYKTAIELREEMLRFCELEKLEDHHGFEGGESGSVFSNGPQPVALGEWQDRLKTELQWLRKNLARANPPPLGENNSPAMFPLNNATAAEARYWRDRIKALRTHDRWVEIPDHAKTVAANIEQHLQARLLDAQTGQIKPQRYENIRNWLTIFKDWVGSVPLEQFVGSHLKDFKEHLQKKMKKGDYSSSYAQSILNEAKLFANWLYDSEIIDKPLRNLRKLSITIEQTPPKTLPTDEVKQIITNADGELKLYCLLMLNCGMTQKDIADLRPEEVDWEDGRIIRKRSKTANIKTVPTVNYKLWKATFELLKAYGQQNGSRVFVNCRGNPLRDLGFKSDTDTKLKKNDTIAKALAQLCKKIKVEATPKMFRATSSNLLFNTPLYRRCQLHELFLDHSVKTVSEASYVANDFTTLDEAIEFLGKQYGIE